MAPTSPVSLLAAQGPAMPLTPLPPVALSVRLALFVGLASVEPAGAVLTPEPLVVDCASLLGALDCPAEQALNPTLAATATTPATVRMTLKDICNSSPTGL